MNDESLQSRVASLEQQLAQANSRLEQMEQQMGAWQNLQIAPESGGGSVTVGRDSVFIRINALTSGSAQMP